MMVSGPVGSLLWRRLRVYQVYGANTDVGKTVFTTVLCKAASRLWRKEHTAFLKPVSAGMRDEADERCKLTRLFCSPVHRYTLLTASLKMQYSKEPSGPGDDLQ